MSAAIRTFGALVSHDSVTLVEYRDEAGGMRVVDHWADRNPSASIGEAMDRLVELLQARGARRATLALAIEQFGVFHHTMTLPGAADDVLRPIVQREAQRMFGVAQPVVAFVPAGPPQERRAANRANDKTAPRALAVAGAPRETIDAIAGALAIPGLTVTVVTVVLRALQSLYEASGGSSEATVVLACLDAGPHLAFFLDGHLELAVDPPIALEGDPPTVPMIVDQVERGAVYFRQQFRGAQASRLLLSAPPSQADALARALQTQLSVRVQPLFGESQVPEAVVAMGAVLESRSARPLDLFPHPPTVSDRVGHALRGPNGLVAAAAAAAVIASLWAAGQIVTLSSTRHHAAALQDSVARALPLVEPMRQTAARRASFESQLSFVRATYDERAHLASALAAVASRAPASAQFDSLQVARAASGWAVLITGEVGGPTGAAAVRTLDGFYRSVRSAPGVASVMLDAFDYPQQSDTSHHVRVLSAGVVVAFRMSLNVPPTAAGAH